MEKNSLQELYIKKKLSMQQISNKENCSLNKISYWLTKYNIPRRSRSEGVYLRANPNGNPFKLKKLISKDDYFLLGMGLGLWWGEGSKKHESAIRLGNSDPKLLKMFLKFLREIFGVDDLKIKFGLQIFDDQNPEEVKARWKEKLSISEKCFLPKVVVTEKRGKGTYKKLNQWGVLTVYFSNVKLRKILEDYMKKYTIL